MFPNRQHDGQSLPIVVLHCNINGLEGALQHVIIHTKIRLALDSQ